MSDVIKWAAQAFNAVSKWAGDHPILWQVGKVATAIVVSSAISGQMNRGLGSTGTQLQFKADPTAGTPFTIGRTAVGGDIAFQYPSGGHNAFMNFIVDLGAGGPYEEIESFTATKTAVTFNSGGSITSPGPYEHYMFMTTDLGQTPAAALACATELVVEGPLPSWTSAHKMSGHCAARWVVEYNTDRFPSGIPQPLWVVKGLKVYDPRLDSTYPGGSGPHRWDDPTTRTFSECPYLNALTYLLGYWSNGKRVGGVGLTPAMIDIAAFVEGANASDANGWKVGGQIRSTDSKWAVLKAILQAGSGEPLNLGAKVSCLINAPRSSLATLTEADIAGQCTIPAMRSRRDRKNSIIPMYRSEAHGWQYMPAAAVTSSTWQTDDGGLREVERRYDMCQDAAQAAQLAAYDLVNMREFDPIIIAAKLGWMGARPGDCITLDLPEKSLIMQKVVIKSRDLDLTTGAVTLVCASETDAKHAFALGQTASPPPSPSLGVPDFTTVPQPGVGAFTVASATSSESGQTGAALIVSGLSDYPFAAEIVVYIRQAGLGDYKVFGSFPVPLQPVTIGALLESVVYDVGVAYRSIHATTPGPMRLLTGIAPATAPFTVTVRDGDTPTWPALAGVPTFSADFSGAIALGVGEAYVERYTAATASSVTVALKISSGGGSSGNEPWTGAVGGGTDPVFDPGHYCAAKPTVDDAEGGVYRFVVEIAAAQPAPGHSPYYAFAPIYMRAAGATSWGLPVGYAGSNSAPSGAGTFTYPVTITNAAAIGQDAYPQFMATTSGMGVVTDFSGDYDVETAGSEVPATDLTHAVILTVTPPV